MPDEYMTSAAAAALVAVSCAGPGEGIALAASRAAAAAAAAAALASAAADAAADRAAASTAAPEAAPGVGTGTGAVLLVSVVFSGDRGGCWGALSMASGCCALHKERERLAGAASCQDAAANATALEPPEQGVELQRKQHVTVMKRARYTKMTKIGRIPT